MEAAMEAMEAVGRSKRSKQQNGTQSIDRYWQTTSKSTVFCQQKEL